MYTPDSLRQHPALGDPEQASWGPPPFTPPPLGVTNGGEPGSGWGLGWTQSDYPSTSEWPRRQYNGTPYPHNTPLPNAASGWASSSGGGGGWPTTPLTAPPMNAAHSWTYGHHPFAPNSPWPTWDQTPATSWGVHTPAGGGGWGAAAPATPYTPWGQPSPYSAPAVPPPASPYDSASAQPISGGWFGAGEGTAAAAATGGGGWGGGGGGGWGGGTWHEGMWREKKHKKQRSDHGHDWHHESGGEDEGYFGRSTSMRRTPPRLSKSLQRSASWGNGTGNGAWAGWYGGLGSTPPQYAQNDLFDEHNLARRPRDWRPDYTAKGGLGAYIPVNKNRTTVKEWNDPVRRHLHPLLSYNPPNPPLYFDLRQPTFDPRDVEFLNLPGRRAANQIDFAQLALQPTCAFMRLYHPRLPWYIDVTQSHPNGVTVFDVLSQVHAQLQTSIHPRHFWNEELGQAERDVLTRTFQDRVKGEPGLVQRGILQVDFVGDKCVLEGLVRGPKGLWEMKLGREHP